MDSGGTTIMGGTATASLSSTGLALISNGVTGSLVSQDTASIAAAEDKRHKISSNLAFDASTDLYDESTESVFDALLTIFHAGNDMVKTNYETTENTSIIYEDAEIKEGSQVAVQLLDT